jgi:hypothetical protein
MRTILPDAEYKAKQAMQNITAWLNMLCAENPLNHVMHDHFANAKIVMDMLDSYKNEVHDCDITIAQLTIENNKIQKIRKILND